MNDRVSRRPSGAATVCLCWVHPLMLSDFRRLLANDGVRVREQRLGPEMAANCDPLRLPRASVYVVEAHPDPVATEAAIARILAGRPGARLLAVAERFDQRCAFSLLRLGVKGLLRFEEAPAHLERAVQEILRDGCWVSRSLLSRFIDAAVRSLSSAANPRPVDPGTALSRREHQVRGLLMENLSNREIASCLQVSERTAKFHVSNLLAKYGLKRRADLVILNYSQVLPGGVLGNRRRELAFTGG